MGRRGPLPQSSSLKLLKGNPGRRRLAQTAPPTVPLGAPEVADFLSDDARREWERLSPVLLGAGLLTPLDGPALNLLCALWGSWVQIARRLTTEGVTVGKRSQPHPLLAPAARLATLVRAMLTEFACTPSSRARLQIAPPAEPPSQLAAFLARHPGTPARRDDA